MESRTRWLRVLEVTIEVTDGFNQCTATYGHSYKKKNRSRRGGGIAGNNKTGHCDSRNGFKRF